MREKIINPENNRFRLITGTFPDKETAEIMAGNSLWLDCVYNSRTK
ncbi:hypothetical protein V8V75_13795 [Peribacillus frigoritolerans]